MFDPKIAKFWHSNFWEIEILILGNFVYDTLGF